MTLILIFIIVLNIVAIALTYYCLSDLEKKNRVVFIAVCVAIIYILTTVVYGISTRNVAVKEVSELGKKIITFMFVPINTIIVVPLLAKSYNKYKTGFLAADKLKNRGIVLAAILIIVLGIECVYFKSVQNTVVNIVQANQQKKQEEKSFTNTVSGQQENIINEVSNNIESYAVNEVNTIKDNNVVNNTNNVFKQNIIETP